LLTEPDVFNQFFQEAISNDTLLLQLPSREDQFKFSVIAALEVGASLILRLEPLKAFAKFS